MFEAWTFTKTVFLWTAVWAPSAQVQASNAPIGLDAAAPSDLCSATAEDAFRSLAGAAAMRVWIDPAVREKLRPHAPPLPASRLTIGGAIWWLAAILDVDAVCIEGRLAVAAPANLPAAWRLAASSMSPDDSADSAGLLNRTGDCDWQDLTVAAAVRRIEETFDVGVLVVDDLGAGQDLVHVVGRGLTLRTVLARIGAQLDCGSTCRHGLVALHGRGTILAPRAADGRFERGAPSEIKRSGQSVAWAELLAAADPTRGLSLSSGAGGTNLPRGPLWCDGAAADVLAARLMWDETGVTVSDGAGRDWLEDGAVLSPP